MGMSEVASPKHDPEDFSFPGRHDLFHHSSQWLECKRAADKIDPGLWRIHDKLYDLSDFARRHPGGPEWIKVTQGTDITEAFESSHFFNDAQRDALLTKYEAGDCTGHPRASPFTFADDGFYKTLKRRVAPILKEVGSGPTATMLRLQDSLAVAYNLLFLFAVYTQSLPVALAAGIALGMSTSMAHNFFHQADNWRRFYFDMSYASNVDWRITHALSHHLFPNTALDYEVSVFYPWLEFCVVPQKSFLHKYIGPIYYHLGFFTAPFLEVINRLGLLLQGRYKPGRGEGIPLVYFAILCLFSPNVFYGAFLFCLIQCCAAYWIIFTSLITTHHYDANYHAGDVPHPTSRDWGLHQLDTVRDVDKSGGGLLLEASTFGSHLLHHLFPTVDHSKLHHLRGALLETCDEFGIRYPFVAQAEMFAGLHRQLMREAPTTFEQRERERTGISNNNQEKDPLKQE